ncbi:hypothetical protein BH10ACT1_BH10ACT1_39040 [soil metagenome]
MSVIPTRRRDRLTTSLVGTLFAVALLAGCAGQKAPGSYTSGVETNFIEGCWSTLVRDANTGAADLTVDQLESDKALASDVENAKKGCTCAYGKFKEDLKFSEFKKLNDDQTETPAKLGTKVTKIYDSCNVSTESET